VIFLFPHSLYQAKLNMRVPILLPTKDYDSASEKSEDGGGGVGGARVDAKMADDVKRSTNPAIVGKSPLAAPATSASAIAPATTSHCVPGYVNIGNK
jgi:hypothetical protein